MFGGSLDVTRTRCDRLKSVGEKRTEFDIQCCGFDDCRFSLLWLCCWDLRQADLACWWRGSDAARSVLYTEELRLAYAILGLARHGP